MNLFKTNINEPVVDNKKGQSMLEKLLSKSSFDRIQFFFNLIKHTGLFKQKKKLQDNTMVISWPFEAIHKTHIHLDINTGELSLTNGWESSKLLLYL